MGNRSSRSLPEDLSQNSQLPIRIVSPDFGHLTAKSPEQNEFTRRLPYYFFLFLLEGNCRYDVDLETFDIGKHDLLFSLPNQVQKSPATLHGDNYYKLGFDDECLSRLPKQYPFLLNPLNQHKISFSPSAAGRLQAIFEILLGLLTNPDTEPDLILAHLNSFLTEVNTAYFAADTKPTDERLAKFIGFKVFVEDNLTDHPTIRDIAESLSVSTDSLNQIVKHYSGLSPKEFMINRLMLEARRRLHHGERTSVKELAFDLGFNDPDYFSRLFKKTTGKTVAGFFKDLS